MMHCTVCGAAAREGAKFCTSCGARLVDTAPVATDPAESAPVTSIEPETPTSAGDAIADSSGADAAAESSDTNVNVPVAETNRDSIAPGGVETAPADPGPTGEPSTQPAEYASSWPESGGEDAETGSTGIGEDVPAEPESTWSSWASTTDDLATGTAPASFATDADQDPEPRDASPAERDSPSPSEAPSSPFATDADQDPEPTAPSVEERDAPAPDEISPSPFATDADQDPAPRSADRGMSSAEDARPVSFATDADQDARTDTSSDEAAATQPEADDPMEESHHGASQWESWAPTATGGATVAASSGDVGSSVRRLLDDLANRIDRLIDPATLNAREVDADDLADQLDRWSNASTDADGLLEVVRAVRTSPRDVDALTRLADRAPDLELLVRHYQSITNASGDWSRKLRDQQKSGTDDA